MAGFDHQVSELGGGSGVLLLAVAVLLGLRHATDPDHLTAVSTLVMSSGRGARRAGTLGLAWGLGHATTLVLFGLPVVLFRQFLPRGVERAAEVAIGAIIVALGVRLLVRWRRGYLHAHPHRHGAGWHAHPHVHEATPADGHPAVHEHAHAEALGRSPRAAYGIGLIHGLGGSAGVSILVVGTIPNRVAAAGGLLLFAGATAVSMAALSSAFGVALGRGSAARRIEQVAPLFGATAAAFGVWYALGAVGAVPPPG